MSFTVGPGGGVRDPEMLRLLVQLTTLVKENKDTGGASASAVLEFIEKHKNVVFVDAKSQHMHTFKEVAVKMAPIIHGIENDEPADWWK